MKFSGARIVLASVLVGGGLAVLPAPADAAVVSATLVKTTWTGGPESTWVHPSPDPSGITYNSRTRSLLISDGEVEETGPAYPNSVWKGTNLFPTSLGGELLTTGLNTTAYTPEPTGVGFRPSFKATSGHTFPERLFVSDDDRHRVYEVNAVDGTYGNAGDTSTSFDVSFLSEGPENDAEDVAVDLELTRNGQLLIVDGLNPRVFVYNPGADRIFNGQAAAGGDDFIERVINVAAFGAGDPEGIAYNAYRQTVLVLDDRSNMIYELALDGTLQNTIPFPIRMGSAAGITLAPPSSGAGGQNIYVVDRGIDNDTDQAAFNDGRLYEVAVPGLTAPDAAPTVNAGPDNSVNLPDAVALAGSVTDDGAVAPTAAWSSVSGPGTASFANPAAASTTATFPAAGTYVLRLTGSDGTRTAADDVTVTVTNSTTLTIPVRAGSDDAEQRSASTSLDGTDLELVADGTSAQTVGLRFTGVSIPKGSTITNAYVQFQVDEATTAAANLTVAGQAADNATTFTTASGNISTRQRTGATVTWAPTAWSTVGARTAAQRTPDLSRVLQEIVSRTNWASGNALALILTGTGTRTAEAFESGAALAPALHIQYTSTTSSSTNKAPVVNAGADTSTVRPDAATLSGSVTDDGTAAPTAAWTTVSGPGTATFANAAAASTTATFPAAGTYVLRLTGTDGSLSASDDVTVVVTDATTTPATQTLAIPVRAGSDDAEQAPAGAVDLGSSDLELVIDGTVAQTVGLRFTGVSLPKGAVITNAYVQFQVDEATTSAANLTVAGQAADNATTFITASGNLSTRQKTAA
ncbi:MAG: PKD domain-containing protein, partial [Actinomycetes bacterium]